MEETNTTTEKQQEQPQFVVDDPVKAINILISAVERAQQRGAYTLQELSLIHI